ncbi:MAG: hypothetical protein ACR2NF_03455 [Pirellulales bacterium]|jgi:hypothetical protein
MDMVAYNEGFIAAVNCISNDLMKEIDELLAKPDKTFDELTKLRTLMSAYQTAWSQFHKINNGKGI